jgi:hypothetical protein
MMEYFIYFFIVKMKYTIDIEYKSLYKLPVKKMPCCFNLYGGNMGYLFNISSTIVQTII